MHSYDTIPMIKVNFKGHLPYGERTKISSSTEAAELLFAHWDKGTLGLQESFQVLLLDNANRPKARFELSRGGITGTLVDLRILFAVILKSLSVGILIAHNHPSGRLVPSTADIQLTDKIKKAAELLDIRLLDHLILAPEGSYYSFNDQGKL